MTGPFDNKGRGAGGVFPNLSDRLDKSGTPGRIECACHPRHDHNVPQTALVSITDHYERCWTCGAPITVEWDEDGTPRNIRVQSFDRMALAQALIGSELIDRYIEYAHKANPSMPDEDRFDLAQQWAHRIAGWLRRSSDPEPPSEGAAPRAEWLPGAAIRASCEWVEANIAPKRCDNEGVADCWRCNTVFLARTLARLSRPSDERVPESEERA